MSNAEQVVIVTGSIADSGIKYPPAESYQNNVDWQNTITGSSRNAIDLNMNNLRAGLGIPEPEPVTNADTGTK